MPSNKTSTPGYLRDVKEAREDSHNVRVLLYGWVTEYNAMKALRIGHHVVDKDGNTLTIVKTGVGDRLREAKKGSTIDKETQDAIKREDGLHLAAQKGWQVEGADDKNPDAFAGQADGTHRQQADSRKFYLFLSLSWAFDISKHNTDKGHSLDGRKERLIFPVVWPAPRAVPLLFWPINLNKIVAQQCADCFTKETATLQHGGGHIVVPYRQNFLAIRL